jgi:hypothetical protein
MAVAFVTFPAEQIVKTAKAFVPQLGNIKLGSTVMILAALAAETDGALEFQISRHVQKKTKKQVRDDSQVIKVSEAINCVDEQLRDPKVILRYAKAILSACLDPGAGDLDLTADAAKCIRENALRQDTVRVKGRYRSPWARPAVGHGHGRGKF